MQKQALIRTIVSMAAIGLLAIGVGSELSAAEVTPEMASRAVRNWRATREPLGCKFGRQVAAARRCEAGGAKFNVVKMEGGGFVVTSADTGVRPILFFSDGEDLDEDPRNPLYALVKQDMRRAAEAAAKRRAGGATLASVKPGATGGGIVTNDVESICESQWTELLEPDAATLAAVSKPSDVRVDMLVQSQWSQSTVSGGNCYNYYTPNNYVCGCVATAMGQIMRYFQYPTASMAQFSNPYCKVSGTKTELTSMGGTYDWANIPLKPRYNTNSTQRKAVGKLCYDAGVAVSMGYGSGGSGSNVFVVPWALINRFGYRGALAALWSDGNSETSLERTRRAMITNFDAGLPMEIGISGDGGHAIVADGYGYSNGSFCCHLNFGWHGSDDGWYIPPSLGDYNLIDELAYNIFPTQDPACAIVSGRVLSSNGSAASGVTVNAVQNNSTKATATTNNKGIFALFVKPGTYSVNAKSGNYEATATAKPTALKGLSIVITDGNPTRSYWTGNLNAEICNVHVGDIRLQLPNVAYIGDIGYSTLAAACNAAAAGQTVKLERDVTENVTVKTACTVDFQGHTMNGIVYCTYNTTGGTVTLKNGTVTGNNDSFDGQPGSQDVFPNGQVTFENMTMTGTIWSDSHPLVFTSGTYSGAVRSGSTAITINGGNFATLTKDGSANFAVNGGAFAANFSSVATIPAGYIWKQSGSGTYPWSIALDAVAKIGTAEYISLQDACTAATAGQTVTLVKDTSENVTLSAAAVVDLGGKTLTGSFTFANGSDTATLKNGTVSGSIAGGAGGGAIALESLTVSGAVAPGGHPAAFASGTYTGTVTAGSAAVTINDGNFKTLAKSGEMKFTVNGGHFGGDFGSVCALPTYRRFVNDNAVSGYPWTVVERRLARIGGNDYFSFADACAAAAAGDVVSLLADNSESPVTVLKDGVIDLGGHTFAGMLVCTNVSNTATIAVANGKVTGSVVGKGKCTVAATNGCTVALLQGEGTGQLKVFEGAKVTRIVHANGQVNVYGGEVGSIESKSAVLDGGGVGTISTTGVMSGSGGAADTVAAASVRLTGGTYGTVTANSSGVCSLSNVVVTAYVHNSSGRLTVSGGKFGSFTVRSGGDKVTIKGGRFKVLPAGEYQLAEGLSWVYDSSDPEYPWTPSTALAQIGSSAFASLADACAAAAAGDTIMLLADDDEHVVATQDGVIDLGGHTFAGELVCTNAASTVVAIRNGTVSGSVATVGKGGVVAVSNGCTVALLRGENSGALKIFDGAVVTRVVHDGIGQVSVFGGEVGSIECKALSLSGGSVGTVSASGTVTGSGGDVSTLTGAAVRLTGGTYGTVTANGSAICTLSNVVVTAYVHDSTGRLTVSDGRFGSFTVLQGGEKVAIKGGRFKSLPVGDYQLDEGMYWVYNAGEPEYPWSPSAAAVARIGETIAYLSLNNACRAAKSGDTVTLLEDDDGRRAFVGCGCTIDFGGRTYSGQLSCTNAASSTVVLLNGTVSGSVVNSGRGMVAVTNGCTVALLRGESSGLLKIYAGATVNQVVQSDSGQVMVYGGEVGSIEGKKITLSGGSVGTIVATDIVTGNGGNATTLTAAAVRISAGNFGAITSNGSSASSLTNLVVDAYVHAGTGRLLVNGGRFGSFTAQEGCGEVVIRGGRFKTKPTGTMTMPAGTVWVYDSSDSEYPWVPGTAKAKIGDAAYSSLADACGAATKDDTVTLLVDDDEASVTLRRGALDLGGKTFSGTLACSIAPTMAVSIRGGTVSGAVVQSGLGPLTVASGCTLAELRGTGTGTVTIEAGSVVARLQKTAGTVSVAGGVVGTLEGAEVVVSGGEIGSVSASGTLTVSGGHFKTQPTGALIPEGWRWECVEGEEYPWRLAEIPPPPPPPAGPTPEETMAKLKSGEVKMSVRQEPNGFVLRVEYSEPGLWYGFWGADLLAGPFVIMPETFREGNGEAMEIVAPPRQGSQGFYKIGICAEKP